MKKSRRRRSAPGSRAVRTVSLHAPFRPTGAEPNDALIFVQFLIEAKDRVLQVQKKNYLNLQSAIRKTRPVIHAVLRDQLSVAAAARKIKRSVPDTELATKLFDFWKKATSSTPNPTKAQQREAEKADLSASQKLLKAKKALHAGLGVLTDAAVAGNADACRDLVELAVTATHFVQALERLFPDVTAHLAKANATWPVIANDEAGWEKEAARRIAKLDLGADLRILRVRFRRARGTDANLPARIWAKAAVRTIEETKSRIMAVERLLRDFGSPGLFADFCMKTGWDVSPRTLWADLNNLGVFSRESFPQWKLVVRQVIRQQIPDFHTRPEWATQRRTAERNERNSVGQIQNAILDDIVSALERIAPEKPC